MIMLMDVSPKRYAEVRDRIGARGVKTGQLRTPLTAYKSVGSCTVGIDNGCFSGAFRREVFERILSEHEGDEHLCFVSMPDVVGDARRTSELFEHFKGHYAKVPRALVAQDGIENLPIQWDDIAAIFIGGTNNFKDGPKAMAVAKAAKILGKWVHVGRVNSVERIRAWMGIADSFDGSGIAKYDEMLNAAISVLSGEKNWHPELEFNHDLS